MRTIPFLCATNVWILSQSVYFVHSMSPGWLAGSRCLPSSLNQHSQTGMSTYLLLVLRSIPCPAPNLLVRCKFLSPQERNQPACWRGSLALQIKAYLVPGASREKAVLLPSNGIGASASPVLILFFLCIHREGYWMTTHPLRKWVFPWTSGLLALHGTGQAD